jgi:transposase
MNSLLPISAGYSESLRYDNLTSAVKKVLRGYRREETTRFIAFRSQWQFQAEFCTPGEPQEKGGVEGEAATCAATIGFRSLKPWISMT